MYPNMFNRDELFFRLGNEKSEDVLNLIRNYDNEGIKRVNIVDPYSEKRDENNHPIGQKYKSVDFDSAVYDIKNATSAMIYYK